MLKGYEELFKDELGTIKGHEVYVPLSENARPVIHKVRSVPLGLRAAVEGELERLLDIGVIEAVDPTKNPLKWATPIVTIVKPTGKVRICGDFKVSINPFIVLEKYPLPKFEDLTAKLSGGRYYSIIDLKDAYLQLVIDEKSRDLLTIATHVGYFRYKRLPFGVSFAPSLFQRIMDKILQGINGVGCFLDDIIVQGSTLEEHNVRVLEVLERLKTIGIRIQETKCKWFREEVQYLGHRIDRFGIHPTLEHVTAIKNLKTPTNVAELKSLLGSINYYSRFVPHLQGICAPLHRLTKKNTKWNWTTKESKILDKLKNILTSHETLVHYNPELPLVLSCDASGVGLGAVLFHRGKDGLERPIGYASRKLTDAEVRYATIEKEALAIIFGLSKFNHYLFGNKFIIKTDHRPLEFIFGATKEIPKTTANRISRWALQLAAYTYKIEYTKGIENLPADVLSRLPEENTKRSESEDAGDLADGHLFHLRLPDLVISKKRLQNITTKDKTLRKVIQLITTGWPNCKKSLDPSLWTYFEKKEELSFEEGIIMWLGRIVVPEELKQEMLNILHEGHPGITSMKTTAKFYVWWPRLDLAIETFVKNCVSCQRTRPNDVTSPLFSWTPPTKPWARVHIDYAGPFQNSHWLIVVDAYSKWLEILQTTNTSAERTVTLLRQIFSRFGVPASIVSDNGPQFTSGEFKRFCEGNGITHIRTTPYHPRTNGLAERFVRTFKDRMKASKSNGSDKDLALQQFLFSYRNSVNRMTNRTPAELLMGRRLTSRLDLLKPDVTRNMDIELVRQKNYHDRVTKRREFEEGDAVWVRSNDGKSFEEGQVMQRTGELSYKVWLEDGKREVRKHADQLRSKATAQLPGEEE